MNIKITNEEVFGDVQSESFILETIRQRQKTFPVAILKRNKQTKNKAKQKQKLDSDSFAVSDMLQGKWAFERSTITHPNKLKTSNVS